MPTGSTARRSSSGQQAKPGANGHKPGPEAGHGGPDGTGPVAHSMSVPRITLPGGTAGTVLWWGGLAAVAAFGVVDWPVAALIGAGTWVAERHARQAAADAAR